MVFLSIHVCLFWFPSPPLTLHIVPFVRKDPGNSKVEVWEQLEKISFMTKMLFSCCYHLSWYTNRDNFLTTVPPPPHTHTLLKQTYGYNLGNICSRKTKFDPNRLSKLFLARSLANMICQSVDTFHGGKKVNTANCSQILRLFMHFWLFNPSKFCRNHLKFSDNVLVFEIHKLCRNRFWVIFAHVGLFQNTFFWEKQKGNAHFWLLCVSLNPLISSNDKEITWNFQKKWFLTSFAQYQRVKIMA